MSEEVFMNIRIDKELRTKINVLAKQKDTTVKAIIKELVEKYIEENE